MREYLRACHPAGTGDNIPSFPNLVLNLGSSVAIFYSSPAADNEFALASFAKSPLLVRGGAFFPTGPLFSQVPSPKPPIFMKGVYSVTFQEDSLALRNRHE